MKSFSVNTLRYAQYYLPYLWLLRFHSISLASNAVSHRGGFLINAASHREIMGTAKRAGELHSASKQTGTFIGTLCPTLMGRCKAVSLTHHHNEATELDHDKGEL